jgi:hypothetical protein
MALTKEEIVEKVEVVGEFKTIQVKIVSIIKEDGVEISKTNKRYTIQSNEDITNQPEGVIIIAEAVWTPAVKQAYLDSLTQ